MSETPAFLDPGRPDVPNLVVTRGVVPFHLPRRPVRGRLVRLGPLAQALLERHPHPDVVARLCGQALALVAALGAALKFRGSFSLQAKGDGPVSPLVADATETGALRCYARLDAAKLAALPAGPPEPDAATLLGAGALAFTADQGPESERYQGIVSIEGRTLAEMALHYFATSEQLRCSIRLACARTPEGWRAAALVLERVARDGGIDADAEADAGNEDAADEGEEDAADRDDAWQTAQTLAATVTDAELLDDALPAETLLWRLFGAEGVALDQARALAFGCRCSRQKLSGILEGFPADDLDDMAVDGTIVMICEFCNHDFRFARDALHGTLAADGGRTG